MKRVAVLTLVFNNYGTRLQSYALCRVLNRIFKDEISVEVINTEDAWSDRKSLRKYLVKNSFKGYGIKAFCHIFEVYRFLKERRKILREDHSALKEKRASAFNKLNEMIPYTNFYSIKDIRMGKLPKYDAIIVGSDQVWNGIKVEAQDVYMLDILKDQKGLTYAASFGMTAIPKHMKLDYQNRINNFSSLLIREKEGVEICRQLGRDDAQLVLDPTLLLESADYDELRTDNKVVDGDYLLVYSLNYSLKIYEEAYKLAKRYSYKMVVLKRSFCPPEISRYEEGIELYAESPENFLSLIRNARCIVTNSYHALLFSKILLKN